MHRACSISPLFAYNAPNSVFLLFRRCPIAARKTKPTANDENRKFAVNAAKLASQTRCSHVVVLDVRGISPVTDYFVIATGTSERQMRTVTEDVQEFAEPRGFVPYHKSTHGPGGWILIDFLDVVMHIFTPEARMFYDLDNLWGEAKSVDWAKEAE